MTIGLVAPIGPVSAAPVVPRAQANVAGSTRTDLPPHLAPQPVSAFERADATDRDRAPQGEAPVDRTLTIDPDTRALVSQVLDRMTGDILSQVPDQALLRLKAYAREALAAIETRREQGRVDRTA